ncbi:MAG TPA: HPP family protein [Solirubrobacterales bacterium]|nr:HPP family protein [Solirubrobacterales bacterium]
MARRADGCLGRPALRRPRQPDGAALADHRRQLALGLVGFAVGQALGHGAIACGIGVGLAIAVMSVTRSLHPPGGAAALTGVIGSSLVDSAGWWCPLAPVALDAVLLVAVGWAFHRLSGHPYPHRGPPKKICSRTVPSSATRSRCRP